MTQWHQHGRWHADWIRGAQFHPPIVSLFHLTLTLAEAIDIPLKVSGDERVEFYVNGVCVATTSTMAGIKHAAKRYNLQGYIMATG